MVVVISWENICIRMHLIVYFKQTQFIRWKLYLNKVEFKVTKWLAEPILNLLHGEKKQGSKTGKEFLCILEMKRCQLSGNSHTQMLISAARYRVPTYDQQQKQHRL